MKYIWLAFMPGLVILQYKTRGNFVLGGEWLLLVLFFLNDILQEMLSDLAKWAERVVLLVGRKVKSNEEARTNAFVRTKHSGNANFGAVGK